MLCKIMLRTIEKNLNVAIVWHDMSSLVELRVWSSKWSCRGFMCFLSQLKLGTCLC